MMKFYNRNDILYVRINGKRVSTKLKDTKQNRKLFESYSKNEEFFQKFNVKDKQIPTLLKLCDDVLEDKEKTLKGTSYRSYSSLLNSRIKPYFQDKKVNDIKPIDIDSFYKTFTDKSSLTICNCILKEAFNKAIINEYINTTPLIVKRPKLTSNYEIDPFSLDEINLLLNTAKGQFRNLLGLAFYSGLRIGEIIGLKWEDVNFQDYTISVNRTITQGFMQTPKTKSSKRTIDMLSQAEQFLQNQKIKTGLSEFVFMSRLLSSYKSTFQLNKEWFDLLKECKLKRRVLYQTRHSFASNMLSNGETVMWVSFMLGHKNSSITLDKYSRYVKKQRTRKTTFLDDDISTKLTQMG